MVRADVLERVSVERFQMVVERLRQRSIGHAPLELGAASRDHRHSARARPLAKRLQQGGLADAGLAGDADEHGAAVGQPIETALDGAGLGVPASKCVDLHVVTLGATVYARCQGSPGCCARPAARCWLDSRPREEVPHAYVARQVRLNSW